MHKTHCSTNKFVLNTKTGSCVNTNIMEMTDFRGIHIYMGIHVLPKLKDYWAAETRVNCIANIMARARYEKLRSALHFTDNSSYPSDGPVDRFFKIRPLIDFINENIKKFHTRSKVFAIDETMVPYKGKMAGNLRQYIANKPISFGFKFFSIADSDGMIHSLIPHQGKSTFVTLINTPMELHENEKELGVGASQL